MTDFYLSYSNTTFFDWFLEGTNVISQNKRFLPVANMVESTVWFTLSGY